MAPSPDRVARELQASLALLFRRIRQTRVVVEFSGPESTALSSLVRNAPATSAELARLEGISAQSMHATIRGLERRGLVARSPDPDDGRRMLLTLTDEGRRRAADKRNAHVERFAARLKDHFTVEEREQLLTAAPLLERLAKLL